MYRRGSRDVARCFFDDLSSLLESTATFASPLIIVGDLNVHVDDVSDTNRNKLLDLLATPNLVQHVTTPTHVGQSREWVDGSWVMGQMGHENRMGHMGHGSLGVDP